MYDFVTDKEFLKLLKPYCADTVNRLKLLINSEDYLEVRTELVGSGARNLITQNGSKPIDLDYNLVVTGINGKNDCKKIKRYVKERFDKVLQNKRMEFAKDSTSCLSTEKRYFTKCENKTEFSIDLAIILEKRDGSWYRLIHEKTGVVALDRWYWNKVPNSSKLHEKVKQLKDDSYWEDVRQTYLDKKNMYLHRNDYNHPSFICYIEAVNEVYNEMYNEIYNN